MYHSFFFHIDGNSPRETKQRQEISLIAVTSLVAVPMSNQTSREFPFSVKQVLMNISNLPAMTLKISRFSGPLLDFLFEKDSESWL